MKTGLKKFALALALAFGAQGASAATLLVSPGGDLFGARGVDVGGTLYDVVFIDGSCVDAFGECDSEDDYSIPYAGAEAFIQALLDQVFVGIYDTDPERTRGCSGREAENFCFVIVAGIPSVETGRNLVRYAINQRDAVPDSVGSGVLNSFAVSGVATYASFAPSAVVPLPAAGWALLAGLGGLAALRRRRA